MTVDLQKHVISDRYKILKSIINEMKKSDLSKDEFVIALEKSVEKILDREFVIEKSKKPKIFRRMSPYIAFCKNFRDENRDLDGKIKGNVHEVTRNAGKTWKSLTEPQKKFWEKVANDLTAKSKIAFDRYKSDNQKPTSDEVNESNKIKLKRIAKKYNVILPDKSDTGDIKFLIKYSLNL